MLVMFILGLVLIGMLALAASSLSGMYASLNDLSGASRERQIELLWESGISATMVQAGPSGEYVAPVGEPLKSDSGSVIGLTIPSATPGPRVNSKGFAPRYCSLGRSPLSGGSTSSIQLNATTSYQIEATSVGGIQYVVRSSDIAGMQRGSSSVLGFIISPFEKSDTLSCAQIAYDSTTGAYSTPGVNSKVVPLFGANGGTLSAGEGINRSSSQFVDASSYSSINEALAPYMSNPPRRLILNLPDRSAPYILNADLTFGRTTSSDAELIIAGAGSSQATISGDYSLSAQHARLVLSNVATEASITAVDADLELAGASAQGLTATNSNLKLGGTSTLSGKVSLDNTKVDQDGNLSVTFDSSQTGAIDVFQSSWRIRGGKLSVGGSSSYGLWIDQASRMTFSASTYDLSGSYGQAVRVGPDSVFTSIDSAMLLSGSGAAFLDIKGKAVVTGGAAQASGTLANGAVLRDGGSILMDNGQQWFSTGSTPQVGVNDVGGISIAGSTATVGGSICWQGFLFTESTAGQVTNNNNENMQGRVTASWSCSQ